MTFKLFFSIIGFAKREEILFSTPSLTSALRRSRKLVALHAFHKPQEGWTERLKVRVRALTSLYPSLQDIFDAEEGDRIVEEMLDREYEKGIGLFDFESDFEDNLSPEP